MAEHETSQRGVNLFDSFAERSSEEALLGAFLLAVKVSVTARIGWLSLVAPAELRQANATTTTHGRATAAEHAGSGGANPSIHTGVRIRSARDTRSVSLGTLVIGDRAWHVESVGASHSPGRSEMRHEVLWRDIFQALSTANTLKVGDQSGRAVVHDLLEFSRTYFSDDVGAIPPSSNEVEIETQQGVHYIPWIGRFGEICLLVSLVLLFWKRAGDWRYVTLAFLTTSLLLSLVWIALARKAHDSSRTVVRSAPENQTLLDVALPLIVVVVAGAAIARVIVTEHYEDSAGNLLVVVVGAFVAGLLLWIANRYRVKNRVLGEIAGGGVAISHRWPFAPLLARGGGVVKASATSTSNLVGAAGVAALTAALVVAPIPHFNLAGTWHLKPWLPSPGTTNSGIFPKNPLQDAATWSITKPKHCKTADCTLYVDTPQNGVFVVGPLGNNVWRGSMMLYQDCSQKVYDSKERRYVAATTVANGYLETAALSINLTSSKSMEIAVNMSGSATPQTLMARTRERRLGRSDRDT